MFSEIDGLPLHPLAVHAAVVLVPLAALLAVLFVLPRTRAWARLPLLLVSLGAAASVFVAKQSGSALQQTLGLEGNPAGNPVASLIHEHEERAGLLFIVVLIFAAVAVVAFVLSRDAAAFHGPIATITSVLLVVGAVAVGVQTYRVGDVGSRAVWNPAGTTDYGSSAG